MKDVCFVKTLESSDEIFFWLNKNDYGNSYIARFICSDINNLIANSNCIEETLQLYLNNAIEHNFDEKTIIQEYIDEFNRNGKSIFDKDNYILFEGYTIEEVMDLVQNFPIFFDKKIVFNSQELYKNEFVGIEQKFPNNKVFIKMKENEHYITYSDYEKTINILNTYVEKTKNYEFSELETIMYFYDIVKQKKYKPEDCIGDFYLSRDLTSVLLSDYAVCEGFAKLLNALFNIAGIKNELVYLQSKSIECDEKHGHVRNRVCIRDDKYNVNGVFDLDATIDSKLNDEDDNIDSYVAFMKSGDVLNCYYEKQNIFLEEENETYYSIYDLKKDYADDALDYNVLRKMGNFCDYKPVEDLSLLDNAKELVDFYKKKIYAEELFVLYCNVRKKQVLENSSIKVLTHDELAELGYALDWEFNLYRIFSLCSKKIDKTFYKKCYCEYIEMPKENKNKILLK